jgi:PAS domain S-box-containing protein
MVARATILNVDDTPSMRYSKTRMLQQAGYTVVEAATGADAMRLLREQKPHLVLLDVNLPDANGIELCKRIKLDPETRNVPVVQISATYTTDLDRILGLEGGADIYLTEPLEPKELETVIGALLRLHRTELGLRETEARWQRFVDANVVGVIVIENDYIVEANDIFLSMLGYSREELTSRRLTWRHITPPELRELSEQRYEILFAQGSTPPFEKEYLTAQGGRISVVIGAAVLDVERRRWMTFVLDVSERKRVEAEKELLFRQERAARTHAEEATRLKDEFLANLSHELRTPMNIIIGWTHLLRTGALSADQQTRAIDAIDRAARSQAQLIEDLLDVSRIVSGKFRLTMKEFKLGPIVTAAVESLRLVAQTRQIALSVVLDDTDMHVSGDPDRLQQVVWNLVSNAVKFTQAGGSVQVRVSRENNTARIVVKDTGVGIAPEFLPFVFDRFRQADGTSTREHMGMGLGLAIVRHVVELHGGTVSAESEGTGRGSTFIARIPLSSSTSAGAVQDAPANTGTFIAQQGGGVKPRVLVVEDDDDARDVASTCLERSGFEIRTAGSAAEALEMLRGWKPDAIVSDISMPDVDGYEFVRTLRALPPEQGGSVPALALTAYARLEDAARALASGYQGHVAKPINPDELVTAISNVLKK